MIRKMRSEDKKTYMEMAREFYHSDCSINIPGSGHLF